MIAGKWGVRGYLCDPPLITLESTLEQVALENADLIIWTGDSTAHDEPFISKAEVTSTLETIINVVQDKFPEYADKFVFSLGNHDNYPNSQQDFEKMQPESSVMELLNFWIPSDQQGDFAKWGNYTRDIEDLNTRIISLNTESCDFKNLYIDSQENDPNN